MIGAALTNYEAGQVISGASTITMQLARNLFLGPDERYEQSMDRKMLEAGLAQELTDALLQGRDPGDVPEPGELRPPAPTGRRRQPDLFRQARVAAHPGRGRAARRHPAVAGRLDPFQNLPGAKARQRTVLDLMVRHGYLTQAEADAAYFEPLTLNPDPDRRVNVVPHFVQYVSDVLDARLGGSAGVRSGLTITSTLDLRFQALAQDIVAKQVKALKPKHDLSNGALVAMLPVQRRNPRDGRQRGLQRHEDRGPGQRDAQRCASRAAPSSPCCTPRRWTTC